VIVAVEGRISAMSLLAVFALCAAAMAGYAAPVFSRAAVLGDVCRAMMNPGKMNIRPVSISAGRVSLFIYPFPSLAMPHCSSGGGGGLTVHPFAPARPMGQLF